MENYKNLGGDSGIVSYKIGSDFIEVYFSDNSGYLYNCQNPGQRDVEEMKRLAGMGEGLNSYINRVVRKNYASKIR